MVIVKSINLFGKLRDFMMTMTKFCFVINIGMDNDQGWESRSGSAALGSAAPRAGATHGSGSAPGS